MLSLYRAWLPPLCLAYPAPGADAVPRPAPPPGAHRPIPRRATAAPRAPASPASSASTELDVVELRDSPEPDRRRAAAASAIAAVAAATASQHQPGGASGAVLDIACCDGPVRFTRVLNESWPGEDRSSVGGGSGGSGGADACGRCSRAAYKSPGCYRKHAARHAHAPDTVQYYPCKTCGSKFPSYYFVHKHRKQCHPDDEPPPPPPLPPHTAAAVVLLQPAVSAAPATVTA